MNYYERVQKLLDYIDENLKNDIQLEQLLADTLFMSQATFYRVFYYLTGFSVYYYIKNRRLSEAALEIINSDRTILDIALDYQYNTHESFTRAFKGYFQINPQMMRKNKILQNYFKRINIMENHDKKITDNYPEPKDIEKIEPMTVASCHIIGGEPEMETNNVLTEWAKKNKIPYELGKIRHFGFDNPDICCYPEAVGEKHGYEKWMIVDKNTKGNERIKIKNFEGGHYVTMKTNVAEVGNAWKRLVEWVNRSKYEIANHQWLEELMSSNFENEEDIALKIMLPIKDPV